jgi:osmotically-inducible protein OsmY
MKAKILSLVTLIIACLSLTSCGVAVVGAVGGGTYYLTKTNAYKRFYTDTDITNQILVRIKANPTLKNTRILVSTKNSNVLLIGQVMSPEQRITAEDIARNMEGVRRVYNGITVSGPTSALTRSSDTWITTKVKSQLIALDYFPSSKVKVVTENGVVYLMGTITQEQGNRAAEVARRVKGVQKVVKLFDYIG